MYRRYVCTPGSDVQSISLVKRIVGAIGWVILVLHKDALGGKLSPLLIILIDSILLLLAALLLGRSLLRLFLLQLFLVTSNDGVWTIVPLDGPLDTLLEGDRRLVSQKTLGMINIGASV